MKNKVYLENLGDVNPIELTRWFEGLEEDTGVPNGFHNYEEDAMIEAIDKKRIPPFQEY